MSRARDLAGIFNLNPLSGTTAQRPTTAEVGDIYYNGTIGKTQIYTTTGWQDMASGIPFGSSSGRPASPAIGTPYFNGEEKRLELYTSTGWQNIVSETPGVVSVSGNYLESSATNTLEITGTNFTTGAIAAAIGTNGVEINANSTTVNSIVSVTAVFSGLSAAYEPYDLKVTNTSNLFGLLPDAIYVNQTPAWQTAAGSLGTFIEQVSVSLSAVAVDPDSTISYSLAGGSSLPSGVTLNSTTGVISGTLPDISSTTTYTFTVNASDGLNTVAPRTFSITSEVLISFEYLMVGGGGSGGWDVGGGGGAGGLLTGTYNISGSRSFSLSIGTGGAAITTNQQRNNGGDTTAFGLTAFGGGGGGNWNNGGAASNGLAGGSGGGGGGWSQIGYGGAGTSGQGFPGGNATTNAAPSYGGGGGGAGGAGSNGTAGDNSQIAGGPGVASSITGTSIIYAAGGKGGGDNTPDGATSNGTDGLGNGGDGEGLTAKRRGGSGVVIIAYPNTYPAPISIAGTLTYDQPTRAGYRVYRFTAGTGTITL
jgi:hypothetical protein